MIIAMKSSNLHERERRRASNSSLSSRGNKAANEGDADDIKKMKKVSVGSLLQLLMADKTTEESSAVPTRQLYADRMSWQATSWDEMERCHDRPSSRRQSCKSESSTSSFYQALINEVDHDDDDDEITRETSESAKETPSPTKTKRKSMQKRLEEDEEAFANSLMALALEAEKRDKDAINWLNESAL